MTSIKYKFWNIAEKRYATDVEKNDLRPDPDGNGVQTGYLNDFKKCGEIVVAADIEWRLDNRWDMHWTLPTEWPMNGH